MGINLRYLTDQLFVAIRSYGPDVNSHKQQAASFKLDKERIKDYIGDMKVKEAKKITDSFTKTSKMPGLSYSLPAWECKTGSKLRKIKGSVCSMCYALKGNYTRYKAIKDAQYRSCLLYTSDAADE